MAQLEKKEGRKEEEKRKESPAGQQWPTRGEEGKKRIAWKPRERERYTLIECWRQGNVFPNPFLVNNYRKRAPKKVLIKA